MFPLMRFRIADRSMEPSFKEGDYVVVHKYIFSKPKIGDIVIISHNGKFLLKRVIKKSRNHYTVQGDNKYHSTDSRHFGQIDRKSIIGKVLLHIRR